VLHRKYWVEQVSYGVGDDIRNVVISDCMLIIYLVAFFCFTNNIKPLECIMIQALTRNVWCLFHTICFSHWLTQEVPRGTGKGQLCMGDVKNLVTADHV
jgi:hypothetical protein